MPFFLLLLWLQSPPDPARQHAAKGLELSKQGDSRAAEAELREAARLSPNDPFVLAILGMTLAQQNKLQDAGQYFEKALALDPADLGTRYNLAVVQLRSGKLPAAKANLERILDARPDVTQASALNTAALLGEVGYQIALEQYRSSQFPAAQATLLGVIARGSRPAKVYNLLAWSYHRQNRLSDAVAAMNLAIEMEPRAENNYDHLAQILVEAQSYPEAYSSVKQALRLAPQSAQAYKLKGEIETHIGDFKQALASFGRAVQLDAGQADSLLELGRVQQKLFQSTEAAASFEKGIAAFPADARFYDAYGRMLLEPGRPPDAVAETRAVMLLQKALALDHTLAESHYELGKWLLQNERLQEALPHLEAEAPERQTAFGAGKYLSPRGSKRRCSE